MKHNETHDEFVTTAGSKNISFLPEVPEGCTLLQLSDFNPFDNPDSLVSLDQERACAAVITSVLFPVFLLIGFPGNVITAIVFYKHGLKERVNLCVFCQSLLNVGYMVNIVLSMGEDIFDGFDNNNKESVVHDWYTNNYLGGFYGLNQSSVILTTVIACERCFCVAYPLKAQGLMKVKTMAFIILFLTVVFTGISFIVIARWSEGCLFNPVTNSTFKAMLLSDFYLKNKYLVDFMDVFVSGIIIPGTTCGIVASTTAYTAFKLKQMMAWRLKSTSAATVLSKQEIALTRMLIGTSILFVVCSSAYFCSRLVLLFYPELNLNGRQANLFILISYVNLVLTFFNPSLNFFVFYSIGSRFQTTVRELFCKFTMEKTLKQKLDTLQSERTDSTLF